MTDSTNQKDREMHTHPFMYSVLSAGSGRVWEAIDQATDGLTAPHRKLMPRNSVQQTPQRIICDRISCMELGGTCNRILFACDEGLGRPCAVAIGYRHCYVGTGTEAWALVSYMVSTFSFFTSIHTTEKHIELIRDLSKTTR